VVVLPSGYRVGHINKVTLCRAWLVLKCVTVKRLLTPTQPSTLHEIGNKYRWGGSGSELVM